MFRIKNRKGNPMAHHHGGKKEHKRNFFFRAERVAAPSYVTSHGELTTPTHNPEMR